VTQRSSRDDGPIACRIRRVLVLLVALRLGACRDRDVSSHASGAEKPIEVASVISGCKDLDDCNRQCEQKYANACVSAGRLYEFGREVATDTARAFRLYEQACDLKSAGGCYNAAVLLEAGKGIERDSVRAHQLYAKVCEMGSKTSCERARALGDHGKQW
jgi:TPR repeat protein